MSASVKDLYVLVADQDMAETLKAVLDRPKSLGIRPIQHDVARHVRRDAGCYGDASRRLRPYPDRYRKAIVVFDKHGCGREDAPREQIQRDVERELAGNGWAGDRAKAVVIEPELEAWVWTGSPHAARALGWQRGYDDLKGWLVARRLWLEGNAKPSDPKAAMKAVLRETRKAHSAALFGDLAKRTTWRGCQCPAFAELKSTLKRWFGDAQSAPSHAP